LEFRLIVERAVMTIAVLTLLLLAIAVAAGVGWLCRC
jgi:hypothetical protein